MDFQYYPTPDSLARKAWSMFQDTDYIRVLEPSAGSGSLVLPMLEKEKGFRGNYRNRHNLGSLDVIEIDAKQHPLLRELGCKVVGHDFLEFQGGSVYSHIIMNPPFLYGAQHLLHAWDILYEGEIVCILNAETVRNCFSKERQLLSRIIEKHGRVEFISQAFVGDEVERETDVAIALVHLKKVPDSDAIVGDLLGQLRVDRSHAEDDLTFDYRQQVMLPQGYIEDLVLRFDAAVLAAQESAMAQAKAAHYSRLLGLSLAERNNAQATERLNESPNNTPKRVRAAFVTQYEDLKDRAWAGVLRSTEVLKRLSSAAQKRMEKEFEFIKSLEFTTANVYGFICGLVESANEIQEGMVLDVFDVICRYHEDNTVFYMGWKSNTKHRTAGMRLKTTRFVLPGHGTDSWNKSISFESQRILADFDKVFAMLDGKSEENTYGLVSLFKDKFDALRDGSRECSDYFEVRYYPKRGTIHFFPKSKELMDRLNRVVGKKRQWLPPNIDEMNGDFVKQYEEAEKFDKELRAEFTQKVTSMKKGYGNTVNYMFNALIAHEKGKPSSYDEESYRDASAVLTDTLEVILEKKGLKPFGLLEAGTQQLLISA